MTTDFQRKNIRLAAENYRGKRLYFVTLCFDQRKRFGESARVAAWLVENLRDAAQGFFVHAYCVMPDHVHVLTAGKNDESDLRAFVESFKRETGFAFSKRTGRRLWQFKYYDRILLPATRLKPLPGTSGSIPCERGCAEDQRNTRFRDRSQRQGKGCWRLPCRRIGRRRGKGLAKESQAKPDRKAAALKGSATFKSRYL